MECYRKRILCMLSLILVLLMLTGCSTSYKDEILLEHDSTSNIASDKTIITFFGFKADAVNLIAIEKALCEFMEANPNIYVTYEGIKGQPYWDAFELRAETGYLDDIIMLDHDRILSLSQQGRLADLSDLSTLDNYLLWTKSQFTEEDGSIYFLPTCISTYNLYVNTDLLEQYGQKLPTNLTEFAQVCDYFVSQGVTPIIANNYASLSSLMIAKGMYSVYCMEDCAAQIEKFNLGEADLVEQLRPGVELVEEMKERGWLDGAEVLATNQTSDDLMLFAQGDRPFMISGGWASIRLDVDFSYGVYPYPILEDGSVLAMSVNTCIGINAESEHLEETKKLVEFLTEPDIMWNYCDSQSSYSPLVDDRIPSDVTIAPSAPYLMNGHNVLQSDYDLNFPLESALQECGNQMMQEMSVPDAMQLLSYLLFSTEQEGELP